MSEVMAERKLAGAMPSVSEQAEMQVTAKAFFKGMFQVMLETGASFEDVMGTLPFATIAANKAEPAIEAARALTA